MRIFWCKRCYHSRRTIFIYLCETLAADELATHLTLSGPAEEPELGLHAEKTNLNTNSDKYAAKMDP